MGTKVIDEFECIVDSYIGPKPKDAVSMVMIIAKWLCELDFVMQKMLVFRSSDRFWKQSS